MMTQPEINWPSPPNVFDAACRILVAMGFEYIREGPLVTFKREGDNPLARSFVLHDTPKLEWGDVLFEVAMLGGDLRESFLATANEVLT